MQFLGIQKACCLFNLIQAYANTPFLVFISISLLIYIGQIVVEFTNATLTDNWISSNLSRLAKSLDIAALLIAGPWWQAAPWNYIWTSLPMTSLHWLLVN